METTAVTPSVAPSVPQPSPENPETNSVEAHQMEEEAPPNPEIARFVKMLQFGVPLRAVEQKMQAEGFDPALLNHNPARLNQKSTNIKLEESSPSNNDL